MSRLTARLLASVRLPILLATLLPLLPRSALAQPSDTTLAPLYARIATDLRRGEPLKIRIHVALCDNASQGIVPVKNPAICDGERPERNIYWATSGGLQGYLDAHGWLRTAYEVSAEADVRIHARWTRRVVPGQRLRALGVNRPFDVEIEALAYRGRRIRQAMSAFVAESHGARDAAAPSHLVGYIGHNYFLDTRDDLRTWTERRQDADLPRGAFALSCYGESSIRPKVAREAAPVLLVNRSLTYPGAWTLGGLVQALAEGRDLDGIRQRATEHFATGKGRPVSSLQGVFSRNPAAPDT